MVSIKKRGKRYRAVAEKVEKKDLPLEDACALVVETASAKFDETVEIALNLGVDPRKADQNVRGAVELPHGLGKNVRVAVFAKGEKVREAEEAGADLVGGEDLAEKIKGGFLEFDSVIATPDMMGVVGKLGKILGPRGLMPSPKVGTVTFDVADAVKAVKAGRAQYRVEKAGIVHAGIGKVSFGPEKLKENALAFIQAINKAKPATSKGIYLKRGHLAATMGPGIRFNVVPLRNI
ncbi:MAG: 50S ribosomal protein L1 [Candidatus Dadabacteria bacterium]|nr:MAG: 50S ribosomal protein L1 [Candidatus Dadabacteria bacterium]